MNVIPFGGVINNLRFCQNWQKCFRRQKRDNKCLFYRKITLKLFIHDIKTL